MTASYRVNDDDKSCVEQESSQLAIEREYVQQSFDRLDWLA